MHDKRFKAMLYRALSHSEMLAEHELTHLKTLAHKIEFTPKDCSLIQSIYNKLKKTYGRLGGNYVQSAKEIEKYRIDYGYQLLKKIAEKQKKEVQYYPLNIERWQSYKNYLTSEQWLQTREFILKRDNHTCQQCKWNKATQIHHIHYKLIWGKEPQDALMAVCRPCHEKIHGLR